MPPQAGSLDAKRAAGVLAVAALIILAPLLIWGPGATDSAGYNLLWTRQFAEGFHRGDLYPRWFPESFEGLGSPTFYFYAPMVFWISGALDWAGLGPTLAIKTVSALLLFGSGLTMYAWLRHRRTRPLFGALLYMAAPYHLIEFYNRGALAEAGAFLWLPLIALGVERLPRRGGVAILALAYAGLILTHLPAAVLATAFLILPFGLWEAWRRREIVLPGLCAGLAGVGLSAFYWLPALTLQAHISAHLLWSPYYEPAFWFVWRNRSFAYLALYPTIAVAMTLLALRARSVWSAVAVIAALAVLGLIPFVWSVPILAKTQFPWRALMIVEFAAVTAIAAQPPRGLALSIGRLMLAAPIALAVFEAAAVLPKSPDQAAILRDRPDAPEYLPSGMPTPGVTENYRLTDLSAYRSLPRGRMVMAKASGPLTIGLADFPIWRVTRDGRTVPHHGPLFTFDASPGLYRIERDGLWPEWWGFFVSGSAALLLAIGVFPGLWARPSATGSATTR